jgi:hypothetical protein
MEETDRLCALLAEEARCARELATVLRAQQRAVVRLDADAVLAAVEQRELGQRQLLLATDARRTLVGRLLAATGAAPGGADALVPRLPLPARPAVAEAVRGLRAALDELAALERQTTRLVGASLVHVQDVLRAIAQHDPGTRYGADATLRSPSALERFTRRV